MDKPRVTKDITYGVGSLRYNLLVTARFVLAGAGAEANLAFPAEIILPPRQARNFI
jgi:hypothetical protein